MTEKAIKKVGRPSKITESVLSKLEEAYTMGCSDREACLLAEISPSVLYRYQEKNPEFRERKQTLQKAMTIQARRVMKRDLEEGDSTAARWYLERKEKQEFSPKADIDMTTKNENCLTIEERSELMSKYLEKYIND